jgi:hypothetical protein
MAATATYVVLVEPGRVELRETALPALLSAEQARHVRIEPWS